MSAKLLYHVFEKNLLREQSPLSLKEFVEAVVTDYIDETRRQGFQIQLSLKKDLCEELENTVRDMTLKKIYGSFSVAEYRKRMQRANSKE